LDSLWGVGSIGEVEAKKTLAPVIAEGKEGEKTEDSNYIEAFFSIM
jgi:hypothetical protein